MPKAFDPYHRWLGIPPKFQPADHYRLLGLDRFEDDPEVIRDAAERQIAHVRGYALGKRGELSQRILNELAKAKTCLLDEGEKAEYDRALRQETKAKQADGSLVSLQDSAPDPTRDLSPVRATSETSRVGVYVRGSSRSTGRKRLTRHRGDTPWKTVAQMIPIVFGGLGGICVAIVVLWVVWKKDPLGIIGDGNVNQPTEKAVASGGEKSTAPSVKSTKPERDHRSESAPKRSSSNPPAKTSASLGQPPSDVASPAEKPSSVHKLGVGGATENSTDAGHQDSLAPAISPEKLERGKPDGFAGPSNETPKAIDLIRSSDQAMPGHARAPFDETQAKRHQAEWAEYLGVPVEYTNSIGMKFVLIPPGEFEIAVWDQQGPRVKITEPFYLGQCEVTQEQYERIMGNNPSAFVGDPARPVGNTRWAWADDFCRRLSQLPQERAVGALYRLPTEAEWEYACRAGASPREKAGEYAPDVLGQYAWHKENSDGQTHPVGQLRPNAWGLFDMRGNVQEWLADWYQGQQERLASTPLEDPSGPASGTERVLRGYSFRHEQGDGFRWLWRDHAPPNKNWGHDAGFRVARSLAR